MLSAGGPHEPTRLRRTAGPQLAARGLWRASNRQVLPACAFVAQSESSVAAADARGKRVFFREENGCRQSMLGEGWITLAQREIQPNFTSNVWDRGWVFA